MWLNPGASSKLLPKENVAFLTVMGRPLWVQGKAAGEKTFHTDQGLS